MSQAIVNQVNAAHPELLQTNINSTCFQFASLVIEALKAGGHTAYLMCKTAGEGQYMPPGFVPFDAVGLDGKTYRITGFSHDAIWSDGAQFDTVGRGNDSPEQIHNPDGSVMTGVPTWNAIPQQYWRPNNPPYLGAVAPPVPGPQPPSLPPYPGDEVFDQIGVTFFADYAEAGQPPNYGMGRWFGRTVYDYLAGLPMADSIKKHRAEWRAVLGLPPL